MEIDPHQALGGPLVFISAAEPSADLHGASLIRAVRALDSSVRFVGVAGPAMQAEGCWALHDMTRKSAMLVSALRNLRDGLSVLAKTKRCFDRYSIAAAIFIDSPTLHLPLAKVPNRHGVPVLYYIAPQVWAWATHRVHRIRRRVSKMAVILPFEESFFGRYGIDAIFVGHPLFDTLAARRPDPTLQADIRAAGSPVVTLVPGSRAQVVKSVLPGQLEVARAIAQRYPAAYFSVSVANDTARRIIEPLIAAAGLNLKCHHGRNIDILETADLVLVASGTSTLEVAYYHRPMIVMYKGSRLVYHAIARWLIHTPHLSLVNILAGRELVPEFMPYYTSTAPIAERALDLLATDEKRAAMSRALKELIDPMVRTGAADTTAAMLLDLMRSRLE